MVITKLYKQHTAVVMNISRMVRGALQAKAGDYVGLDINEIDQEVTIFKIHGRIKDARKSGNDKGKTDKGRQA